MYNLDYIDLSNIPLYSDGRYNGKRNWHDAIGKVVCGEYHGEKYILNIIGYEPKGQILHFIINGEEKKIITSNLLKNKMGSILEHITKNFRYDIGDVIRTETQDLTIVDRKIEKRVHGKSIVNEKLYKYICNKCGFDLRKSCFEKGELKEYWVCECSIIRGTGCPCCGNIKRIVQTGINDIHTTDPWMEKYLANKEDAYKRAACSEEKVYIKCPNCDGMDGEKRRLADIYHRKRISCSKCNDGFSMPNRFMYSLLSQFKENFDEFETEFSPKWAKIILNSKERKVKYDFMIVKNGERIVIEMDGAFHFIENKLSKENLSIIKEVDEKKDLLAIRFGYKIIRIDCKLSNYQYIIENILKSEINNFIDFKLVDWERCISDSQKSIVKEVCICKKSNPELSTVDISKKFNIDRNTVRRYLKTGSKIGWCQYDANSERKKRNKRSQHTMMENRYKNDIPILREKIDTHSIIYYNSMISASEKNEISYYTLSRYIKKNGQYINNGYVYKKVVQ